jgi:hypothetical protein
MKLVNTAFDRELPPHLQRLSFSGLQIRLRRVDAPMSAPRLLVCKPPAQ